MKAFRVYFRCRNCSYEWYEDFEEGDRVEYRVFGVFVASNKCTHTINCPYCRWVRCPVCKVKDDVVIVKRKPLVTPTTN